MLSPNALLKQSLPPGVPCPKWTIFTPNHSMKGFYSECVSIASPAVSTTSPLHDGLWHLCSLPSASFSSSVCLPSVLLGCFSPACWWWSPLPVYTGFPCSVLMFVLPFLSHFYFTPRHLHASLYSPFPPASVCILPSQYLNFFFHCGCQWWSNRGCWKGRAEVSQGASTSVQWELCLGDK